MPREKVLAVLHEALAQSSADTSDLVERLAMAKHSGRRLSWFNQTYLGLDTLGRLYEERRWEAGERYPSWRTEYGYRAPETVAGGIADIRNALFEIHRRVLRELADVGDDELERPALFWDGAKPVRFRMHRFEEHLRQHTIQVDKTLVALGHPPTEAERLVRNLYNAVAGLESVSGAAVGNELLAECAAKIDAIAVEVERIAV